MNIIQLQFTVIRGPVVHDYIRPVWIMKQPLNSIMVMPLTMTATVMMIDYLTDIVHFQHNMHVLPTFFSAQFI